MIVTGEGTGVTGAGGGANKFGYFNSRSSKRMFASAPNGPLGSARLTLSNWVRACSGWFCSW